MKRTCATLILLTLLSLSQTALAYVDPYTLEPPVEKGYAMPYTITVYLSQQMVVAYDAKTTLPARYMICSSGSINPTPRFNLNIPGCVIQPWAYWVDEYVRYPTKIKGSYYFHSITYDSKSTVNKVAWNKLGQPASHGCVRLTPLDAQWIAYNCKKGTRVRIVERDDSGLELKKQHDAIKQYLNINGIAAVQPTLKPTPTPIPPTLDRNSTQTVKIKSLQNKLSQRGFYNGKLSGTFDAATEEAWNEYQLRQGWPADGVATPEEQAFITQDETTIAYRRDLKSGSTGIIVKLVEDRLSALGFFKGVPNKVYDASTVLAVKRYQKSVGIVPVDGKLAASQQPNLFSAVAPSPTPDPGLTPGSSGSKVKKLQNRLYTLGFFASQINGVYNAATKNAVEAFQQAASLPVTGNADEKTYNLAMTSDDYAGTARTLNIGSKGIVVTFAERALLKLGLFAGTPDVLYDKATYQAVKAFQSQTGLKATGVADSKTLIELFAA